MTYLCLQRGIHDTALVLQRLKFGFGLLVVVCRAGVHSCGRGIGPGHVASCMATGANHRTDAVKVTLERSVIDWFTSAADGGLELDRRASG